MKCAINEIFGPTIQGEGLFNGVPSIFVRFNGCNLRCCFKGGSICDTAYTSHRPEEAEYNTTESATAEIIKILEQYPNVTDIVFTGGEPMLQQDAMADIIKRLGGDNLCYTVETNGTIPVKECMEGLVNLWSISPKLSNSEHFDGCDISEVLQRAHHQNRLNYNAILTYIDDEAPVQLKFVYTDAETETEIAQWMQDLYDIRYIAEPLPVLIMPEGEVVEQITKSSKDAIRACIKHGWRFCDRVHIRICGNKRAV